MHEGLITTKRLPVKGMTMTKNSLEKTTNTFEKKVVLVKNNFEYASDEAENDIIACIVAGTGTGSLLDDLAACSSAKTPDSPSHKQDTTHPRWRLRLRS